MRLSILLDQNIPCRHRPVSSESAAPVDLSVMWADVGLIGASDSAIFEWAQDNNAIIVTFDEDFADARMYPIGGHAGVIRLRVWPTTIANTEAALGRLLTTTQDEVLPGSLVIIDNTKIRVRRTARHG